MNTTKPELYTTMGLPSSGKTYFSQRVAGELGVFFLNTDLLRLAMFDTPEFSAAENDVVYRAMNHVAERHVAQGLGVVCNGNYNQVARRAGLREIAERYGATCLTIWVDAPEEVLKRRIQTRDHEIEPEKMVHQPLELLERMQRTFEAPTADELVIHIDGTIPYEQQIHSFMEQRENYLRPKI